MKTRLWIVVIGICLGMAGRWVFGNRDGSTTPPPTDAPHKRPDADLDRKQDNNAQACLPDALIPPAQIPALTSVTAVESDGGDYSEQFPVVSLLDPDFTAGERAAFHPHGDQVCASGCAVSNHPTGKLTAADYKQLVARFADDPIDESSLAFETLLFYGRQTQAMLTTLGPEQLDPLRTAALKKELKRTHAKVWIRVIDEQGEIRSYCPPTSVPMDRRHVFHMDTSNLQPLVTSGTVKRVGLDRVWTRL